MSDASKTEKPTPQRLRRARREGKIPRSPDVGAWAGVLVASWLVPGLVERTGTLVRRLLDRVPALVAHPEPAAAMRLWGDGMSAGLRVVLPFVLALGAVGILAHTAQGGLRFSPSLLKPKPSKLNPLTGLKRMLGAAGLWEAGKALLKASVIAYLTYRAGRAALPTLLDAGRLSLGPLLGTVSETAVSLLRTAGLAGLVLALADYGMQRRRVGKSLRMSRQDIKDENKQSEGDPQVKGQIRARQLAMSRNRMMADVAKADVVVVNPTHVAVALRYDTRHGAPRVVAKGAGQIAARIRDEAERHRVPMVRDVPLARTIYRACNVGEEIPPELYAAVARVLAFIFALRTRGSAAGLHQLPAA